MSMTAQPRLIGRHRQMVLSSEDGPYLTILTAVSMPRIRKTVEKHRSKTMLATVHARDRISHSRASTHVVQHEAERPIQVSSQSCIQRELKNRPVACINSYASHRLHRNQSTKSQKTCPPHLVICRTGYTNHLLEPPCETHSRVAPTSSSSILSNSSSSSSVLAILRLISRIDSTSCTACW
jgi:hypothetical protein